MNGTDYFVINKPGVQSLAGAEIGFSKDNTKNRLKANNTKHGMNQLRQGDKS